MKKNILALLFLIGQGIFFHLTADSYYSYETDKKENVFSNQSGQDFSSPFLNDNSFKGDVLRVPPPDDEGGLPIGNTVPAKDGSLVFVFLLLAYVGYKLINKEKELT